MPYKHTKMLIPREYDRRVKYTEEDRERVRRMYTVYKLSQRAISRETGISCRMVAFILFPDKLAVVRAQFKERRKDGRYYPDKKKWNALMREHRHYKQALSKEGKLI